MSEYRIIDRLDFIGKELVSDDINSFEDALRKKAICYRIAPNAVIESCADEPLYEKWIRAKHENEILQEMLFRALYTFSGHDRARVFDIFTELFCTHGEDEENRAK